VEVTDSDQHSSLLRYEIKKSFREQAPEAPN
jgi:hypothetical protein